MLLVDISLALLGHEPASVLGADAVSFVDINQQATNRILAADSETL